MWLGWGVWGDMKIALVWLMAGAVLQAEVPLEPGAEVVMVVDGFKFTEGPAVDPAGNVYFTDQPNDRICKWDAATGKVADFMKPAGRANGLYFDREGKLIACADEKSELWRIDPATKEKTVLLSDFGGKLLNGPNDVWVDLAGGMYFTDPFYKRDYWKGRDKPAQEVQRVFYLPKGAKAPVIADDTLVQPNGIVGTPDGKLLFVADIGAKKTYRYDIGKDGALTNRTLFCEMGSDGMTRDSAGNIYLTGKGVIVFDKDGKKLGDIPIDKPWTANVCFGGADMKTLFITASDAVFTVRMSVAGER